MAAVKSRQNRPKKATSSGRNELKFGRVTNNHRLFSKMQKYGIPKFWSQWHFNREDCWWPEFLDTSPVVENL